MNVRIKIFFFLIIFKFDLEIRKFVLQKIKLM